MILNDKWLLENQDVLTPFTPVKVKEGFSYGVGSFGYDVRLADEFRIFTAIHTGIIDPKNLTERQFISVSGMETIVIPANSFILGRTLEYVKMPKDVLALCIGKSTYARAGLIVNATPIEPGWEGHITLELVNPAPMPIKIYANEGIAQLLFFQGEAPANSYSGKYQGQTGVTIGKVL